MARPDPSEYAAYYGRYVDLVEGDDLEAALRAPGVEALVRGLDAGLAGHRYAPGKWTLARSVQHVVDSERIFAARALRIARGDATPLPGFDQDALAEATTDRGLEALADELAAVRASTLALFRSLDAEALGRVGTVSGGPMSARAAGWIIAGHDRHHQRITRDRYLGGAST